MQETCAIRVKGVVATVAPKRRVNTLKKFLLSLLLAAWASGAAYAAPAMVTEKSIDTKNIGAQPALASQANRWARFPVTLKTNKPVYRIGDEMDVTITAARDCYIVLYYINSKGQTSIICPSPFSSENRVQAGEAFHLRDNAGQLLRQYGPVGKETIQVIATEKPLDMAAFHKISGMANKPRPQTAAPVSTPRPPAPSPTRPATVQTPKPQANATTSTVVASDEFETDGPAAPPPPPAKPPAATPPAPKPQPAKPPAPQAAKPQAAKPQASKPPATTAAREEAWEEGGVIPVASSDEFVTDTAKAIQKMIAERASQMSTRYKSIGPNTRFNPRDAVYGLSTVTYKVVK